MNLNIFPLDRFHNRNGVISWRVSGATRPLSALVDYSIDHCREVDNPIPLLLPAIIAPFVILMNVQLSALATQRI